MLRKTKGNLKVVRVSKRTSLDSCVVPAYLCCGACSILPAAFPKLTAVFVEGSALRKASRLRAGPVRKEMHQKVSACCSNFNFPFASSVAVAKRKVIIDSVTSDVLSGNRHTVPRASQAGNRARLVPALVSLAVLTLPIDEKLPVAAAENLVK